MDRSILPTPMNSLKTPILDAHRQARESGAPENEQALVEVHLTSAMDHLTEAVSSIDSGLSGFLYVLQ